MNAANDSDAVLECTAGLAHPDRFSCNSSNASGLHLDFSVTDVGGVSASFECSSRFEGYPGTLHGGIATSLLDSAMTNCLFARGKAAVTLRLTVRFRHPVLTEKPAIVRARLQRHSPPRHVLTAEIVQDGKVKVTAEGRFLEQPHLAAGRTIDDSETQARTRNDQSRKNGG